MERTFRWLGGPSTPPSGVLTTASTVNCPARVTCAFTDTWRRPSGGTCWTSIGATRSPDVLLSCTCTRTVTGSALATVTGSGASELPSAYGLGGSSTRIELRIASTRASTAAAASCAAGGDPRLAADAPRSSPNCRGVNSWSAVMPTLLSTTALRRSVRARAESASTPTAAAGTSAASTGGSGRTGVGAAVSPRGVGEPGRGDLPRGDERADGVEQGARPGAVGSPLVRRGHDDRAVGPRAERHRAEEVLRGQRAAVARERLGGGRGAGPGRHRRGRGCGGGAGEERVGEQRGDRPSGERHHATADAPADGVRGEQHRPRAGGRTMSRVGVSSTPSAGQAMSAGTGVCSSVDRICRPGLSARAAASMSPPRLRATRSASA